MAEELSLAERLEQIKKRKAEEDAEKRKEELDKQKNHQEEQEDEEFDNFNNEEDNMNDDLEFTDLDDVDFNDSDDDLISGSEAEDILNELETSDIEDDDFEKAASEKINAYYDSVNKNNATNKQETEEDTISAPVMRVKVKPNNTERPAEEDDTFKRATGDDVIDDLDEVESENKRLARELQEKLAHDNELKAKQNEERRRAELKASAEITETKLSDTTEPTDDVDDIVARLEDDGVNYEDRATPEDENMDVLEVLDKIESEKTYASIESNETVVGPSDYLVEKNEEFSDSIEDVLKNNNITIVKKNDREKNAILEQFANDGTHVTSVLVNSGIFVTMSGAGTNEVMAMNRIDDGSQVRNEMGKLQHVSQHIVGSSIGKMKLSQLIKVVSYYDIDQLYYALYAASYPDEVEMRLKCPSCGQSYYVNLKTRDMLLNPDDFEKRTGDIKDNVTTYERLLETSELGKIYKKAHGNNLIIWYRHPSIENYLNTKNKLREEVYNKYSAYVSDAMIYSIAKVAVRVKGNEFIEVTDPNDILEKILGQLKDPNEKYNIYDMARSIVPSEIPRFGIKKHVCPHCSYNINEIPASMDEMLFTQANQREEMATYKWIGNQERIKKSKKA